MLRQYQLVERVKSYDPDADEALLNRAYVFSVQKHGTQKRASGDPYFSHPIEVAGILTELKLDEETIVTAMLHDTVEDTLTTLEEVESQFGPDIAKMVDGVTKLSKLEEMESASARAAENLRKFILAMSDDIRVLLVKLADRLHNMRTLHHIKAEDKRRRIARETMDIYAPLAERIGLYEFMRELQTLAFQHLEPDAYELMEKRLQELRKGGQLRVNRIASSIQRLLNKEGLEVKVVGREKSSYSIWRKMSERHISFEQLSDVMAFRVLTNSVEDCYRALGIIHTRWQMVPGRFKDYISTPKPNGYESLHTTVVQAAEMKVEIQIRTIEMNRAAEAGLAAHWAYKQGSRPDGQAGWLRDLMEIMDHATTPEELLEHTRLAMYQDRIFAFTPKGELVPLPKGATVLDFAYALHTKLGDRAVGARINGQDVPLRTVVQNGDHVTVLKSDGQVPQPAWLAFVVTGKAKASIRRFVRNKDREETTALGGKILEEMIQRLPSRIKASQVGAAAKRLGYPDRAHLEEAIARHKVEDRVVMEALMPGSASESDDTVSTQRRPVSIEGMIPGLAFHMASCCNPIPGDRIVGLRGRDRVIRVHSIDCAHLSDADSESEDWIDLAWDDSDGSGTARLDVVVKNEPGALAQIAGIFGQHKANIVNIRVYSRDSQFHGFDISLEVHDLAHLMRIIAALRAADVVVRTDRHSADESDDDARLAS